MASTTTSFYHPPLAPSLASSRASLFNPTHLSFPFNTNASTLSSSSSSTNLSVAHAPPTLHIVCARGSRGKTTGKRIPKCVPKTDPVYRNRLVHMFVNRILKNGKKSLAFLIIYQAMKKIQEKTGLNPLIVLRQAVQGVTPDVAVKSRRVGGSTHQVPTEVASSQGKALAIRWILEASRKRQGRSMIMKLSSELMDAAKGTGDAIRKREETHRMAEANRAFAHYR